MVSSTTKLDDGFCYYKCRDCGRRYPGYSPDFCECTCTKFDLVLSEDWWWKGKNMVISTAEALDER